METLERTNDRPREKAARRPRLAQRVATRARSRVPMAILFILLVFLVIMPVGVLLYAAVIDVIPRPGHVRGDFVWDNIRYLRSAGTLNAARNSIVIGAGGTALAISWGAILAWLAARTNVPGRPLAQLAGIVPLFMSSLVGALAWAFIASPGRSYVNLLLADLGIPFGVNIYSMGGIVFVFGLYYTPYTFLFLYSALTLMNPELEEVAQVHGASTMRTASFVTFPLITPAILGSSLLTFVLIIENFPVPTVLGTPSGIDTLPSFIYRLMNAAPPRANQAAAVGLLLMVVMAGVIWMQRRLIAGREYTTVTGKGFRPRRIELGPWRWPAFAFVLFYLVLAVVLPFFALFQMALRPHAFLDGFMDLFDVSVFTVRHFDAVLDYEPFRIGFRNSLITGAATAVIGGVLHLVMSYTVYRTKARGRQFVEYIGMAPLAVPALVLGMGFLWTWFLVPLPLYGTLLILVLAYSVRFMPQGFRSISSSILQVHTDLEESALVSGAGRARTTAEITVPLIRSGIISTALLLLILSMRELSAAIFLFTSSTRVLSVVVFDLWDSGVMARAAAVSILYSAVLMVIVLAARRWLAVREET